MKKVEYKPGDVLGNTRLIFIEEVEPYVNNGIKYRRASFECSCKNTFIEIIAKIKANQRVSCGCNYTNGNYKHGLSRTSIYNRWRSIRSRCNNPLFHKYHLYGGRGITLYEPWIGDFKAFYEYISELPNYDKKGYTLDRKNNNGNYEPGNIRWVNWSIQNKNKRKYKSF